MLTFPHHGHFFIESIKNGMVLDVYDGEISDDAKLIVWPRKESDNENQLWSFDNGFLINKKSGKVVDVHGGNLKSDAKIVQFDRKTTTTGNQRWGYRDGFIYIRADPRLVLDIKGESDHEGTQVILYARKDKDNENQQWRLVPAE
ncbi:hypothetical protein EC973_006737 [Apophysomyces ossiformis]|uniref:Ricin B lectin domain-containing protein n=1 Tax=Apophysomyces ossiformis TaxID=679940 RepID=A0A8H7ELN6_9FUNG|nr:hypothetical protein EC973_006737 [Apophysomyces ossiformis]